MGRRSDHTREELKEMFIEAGQQLVMEEGLHSLNARTVAAKIGYSVGTLYNVFRNLSDLVVHINGRTLDTMRTHLEEAARHRDPTAEFGDVIGKAYMEFAHKNLPLWRLMFEYQFPEGETMPEWWREEVETVFKMVEGAIRPTFKGSDQQIATAARVIWAGLTGITMLAYSGRLESSGSLPPQQLAKTFFKYCRVGHNALVDQGESI
jgi:AcrR family transcriptional regulator